MISAPPTFTPVVDEVFPRGGHAAFDVRDGNTRHGHPDAPTYEASSVAALEPWAVTADRFERRRASTCP